jgi:hypothetical protein
MLKELLSHLLTLLHVSFEVKAQRKEHVLPSNEVWEVLNPLMLIPGALIPTESNSKC